MTQASLLYTNHCWSPIKVDNCSERADVMMMSQMWKPLLKKSCCDVHNKSLLWWWPGFIYGCLSALNVSFTVCRDRVWCWHVNHNWRSTGRQGEAFPLGTYSFGIDVLVWHFIALHWVRTKERGTETVWRKEERENAHCVLLVTRPFPFHIKVHGTCCTLLCYSWLYKTCGTDTLLHVWYASHTINNK